MRGDGSDLTWDNLWAIATERDAAEAQNVDLANKLNDLAAERDSLRGVVQAGAALAEQWRAMALVEGLDDPAVPQTLDYCADELRAALATAAARCPECNHEPGCACPDTPRPHGCQTCLAAAADAPQPEWDEVHDIPTHRLSEFVPRPPSPAVLRETRKVSE